MKIESDPSGKRPFRYDTKFWSHFGYGEGWTYGRCNRCVQHVYTTHTPGEDTVNCWKILVFEDAVTNFEEVKRFFIQLAEKNRSVLGKWKRGSGSVAVIYAKSEAERDKLKARIYSTLKRAGLLKKAYLPYRRGCKAFEKILGPWREWKVGVGKQALTQEPVELDWEQDRGWCHCHFTTYHGV